MNTFTREDMQAAIAHSAKLWRQMSWKAIYVIQHCRIKHRVTHAVANEVMEYGFVISHGDYVMPYIETIDAKNVYVTYRKKFTS